jgi:PncC family amidohydrolase
MDKPAADTAPSLNIPARLERAAQSLLFMLRASGRTAVFAESCTAGLASSACAEIPGASQALWGSFVCYTPEAKVSMLGLDRQRLAAYGLVSRETACDMANAALAKSSADMAASVTGLAGPEGDGSARPVGTVWVAVVQRKGEAQASHTQYTTYAKEFHFSGGRNEVRMQAAAALLETLLVLAADNSLDMPGIN